jgi:hypothetical protein
VTQSYPSSDSAWTVTFRNDEEKSAETTIRVWTICANVD